MSFYPGSRRQGLLLKMSACAAASRRSADALVSCTFSMDDELDTLRLYMHSFTL